MIGFWYCSNDPIFETKFSPSNHIRSEFWEIQSASVPDKVNGVCRIFPGNCKKKPQNLATISGKTQAGDF